MLTTLVSVMENQIRMLPGDEFSGVEDSLLIQSRFQDCMNVPTDRARGLAPPRLLREAYSVLPGNDAAPGEHLGEQFIQCGVDSLSNCSVGVVVRGHDVDVDVAIARVAKARDGIAPLLAQQSGEFREIHEPASRHGDIL